MNNIRGQEVTWSRAEAIHRQTEGNPLFVQEVLRYLVEEGLVVREGGRYARTDAGGPPEAGIPEGLRDVIGKRLSRLSEKANQALSVASVIGRDFRLDVLQQVLASATGAGQSLTEEEVIEALEEAQERAIIEERPAAGGLVFRFTHALFRQILYEEIFAARRIRWHQQVARALEEVHARRLEEHAAELAEHFSHSTDPEDLNKAVQYAELAAQRAMSVFAYAEAERHLGQALKAQDVLDPDAKTKRCDLLLAMGEAMLPQENPRRVVEVISPEAFALAESMGDRTRELRVALQACETHMRIAGAQTASGVIEWARRVDRHAAEGTIERVYADIYLGLGSMPSSREEAHAFLRRGMERAFELGDNRVFFFAAGWVLTFLQALRDRQLINRIADQIKSRSWDGVRNRDLSVCLGGAGRVLFERGERALAEQIWNEMAQLSGKTRDVSLAISVLARRIFELFLEGRLEEALSRYQSFWEQSEEAGVGRGFASGTVHIQSHIAFYLGTPLEPLLIRTEWPGRAYAAVKALLLAMLRRSTEARAIRQEFGDIGAENDETSASILSSLLESSVLSGDVQTASALRARMTSMGSCMVHNSGVSLGRLLGEASVLLGKPEDAQSYYAQALEVCEKVRFRPEIALIRLDIAELLLERALTPALPQGDREQVHAEAIEHLDFAIAEFREMKMQPSLERALRHRGLLRA